MSDEIWKRAEIESPCVKLCVVHPEARICIGCLRSIDEITMWSRLSPDSRSAIMADLPSRAPLIAKRRGGRAARLQG
ncbi:MAG: DUF1289 domain-containing protein [Pseudotabrizicola sp.]|uniref:DUF1289 domain-containing protein n=1 Tax=Pseudotabrizicola sp. TaxID=2939647 RepID=UPI00272197DD|nr:DUF1289 domain-containing protein [Pseudotabrizicola sp.]MDO8883854.1 DUF1289 domain-containing protein [Pseudotabrizicola sp.]MDP2079831.1 DUF1289 domain-containing protein [Pseudotabrizicola sp.]MDZ7574832.1 DUF1289 domain-containing protein [Pseudotabrizicola sp.]